MIYIELSLNINFQNILKKVLTGKYRVWYIIRVVNTKTHKGEIKMSWNLEKVQKEIHVFAQHAREVLGEEI